MSALPKKEKPLSGLTGSYAGIIERSTIMNIAMPINTKPKKRGLHGQPVSQSNFPIFLISRWRSEWLWNSYGFPAALGVVTKRMAE